MPSKNLVSPDLEVTKKRRQDLNNHRSMILWFTGLSGSGKSTLANEVEKLLYQRKIRSYVLDGDNIRQGLNKDLGFSPRDREENIRRIGEVARLFVEAGTVILSAFISPYRKDRQIVRNLVEEDEFIEIHVKCPIEVCEKRDVKGMYKKARKGIIKDFTGVSAPYEEPRQAEIVVETDKLSPQEGAKQVVAYLVKRGYINGK